MRTTRIAALLTTVFCLAASAADVSLERITADPPLQGRLPRQAEISPGGAWVTYLRPSVQDSEQLELWAQPVAGGEVRKLASAADLLNGRVERLSEAEKMALERKRIGQRGITGYQWCGDGDQALIFPLSGDLYLLRLESPGAQRLTQDEAVPEQDPRCSPDGRQIAYVKGGNVWVQSLEGKAAPRAVTSAAADPVSYGLAEFIAAEELDRKRGFWWSPDGQRLLVLRVDETGVPIKTRAQIHAGGTTMTEQRYPAAGESNAKVTAQSIDLGSGARQALPLPPEAEYIARAGWFADGKPWLQWFNREQTRLVLSEFDGAKSRVLIDERDVAWVETHDDFAELKSLQLSGKPALLWSSEVSGLRQLQVIDRVTGERKPLTNQAEPVAHLICVADKHLVFAGALDRGRAREVFITEIEGGATRRLAGHSERHWRDAKGDRACQRLLTTRSAWGQPPALALRTLEERAEPLALPGDAPDPLLAQISPRPQSLNVRAADGATPLNVAFFPPLVHKPGTPGKYPLIVMAYGGPHASTVNWAWHKDSALIAYWQRKGYGLLLLDTRGMAHRDRAFTRAHHRAFGKVEVDDLFAVVKQLPTLLPRVDTQRLAFWGWSYGGYLAARAMLDANSPFAAAVAVAPPTDWSLYDTAYTERYLGQDTQAASYRDANLISRASLLAKPLLIVHGTADDNVLFDNSLKLIEALQNEGKLFDTLIYPGKAHGIAGKKTRLHLYRSLDAFFERHIKP